MKTRSNLLFYIQRTACPIRARCNAQCLSDQAELRSPSADFVTGTWAKLTHHEKSGTSYTAAGSLALSSTNS